MPAKLRYRIFTRYRILLSLLGLFFFIACFLYYFLHAPFQNQPHRVSLIFSNKVTVPGLLQNLEKEGLLKHYQTLLIYYYLRFTHQDKSLRAGEYEFHSRMSPLQLIHKMQKGEVVQYSLTLIEGDTYADFQRKLHNEWRIDKILEYKSECEVAQFLQVPYPSMEGLIFPDTYHYTLNTTDKRLITLGYALMQSRLQQAWERRSPECILKNPYEVLILASIIEKETGFEAERAMISGVFQRRIQNNMRLDADPTVLYGLRKLVEYQCDFKDIIRDKERAFWMGQSFFIPQLKSVVCVQLKEKYQYAQLTREDLRQLTPYNTYIHKGLPPTPIALPSLSAIYAACHPDQSNSLYFVSMGNGRHYFSATLEEHNRAVQQYIRNGETPT